MHQPADVYRAPLMGSHTTVWWAGLINGEIVEPGDPTEHDFLLWAHTRRVWWAGLINGEIVEKKLPAPEEGSAVFVCGPPGFMKAVSGDKAEVRGGAERAGRVDTVACSVRRRAAVRPLIHLECASMSGAGGSVVSRYDLWRHTCLVLLWPQDKSQGEVAGLLKARGFTAARVYKF
jgi:hypothetical protein